MFSMLDKLNVTNGGSAKLIASTEMTIYTTYILHIYTTVVELDFEGFNVMPVSWYIADKQEQKKQV